MCYYPHKVTCLHFALCYVDTVEVSGVTSILWSK